MTKIGDEKKYRIPMRAWVSPFSSLVELFKNIRSEKEDIKSVTKIDVDTIEVVTVIKKLEEEN
jgi:hypothetical protein